MPYDPVDLNKITPEELYHILVCNHSNWLKERRRYPVIIKASVSPSPKPGAILKVIITPKKSIRNLIFSCQDKKSSADYGPPLAILNEELDSITSIRLNKAMEDIKKNQGLEAKEILGCMVSMAIFYNDLRFNLQGCLLSS